MMTSRIAAAMADGLSFVCATCRKYWEGQDKNLGRCTATMCGSPLRGMLFPEYNGILTEERFADWCFVCGTPATQGVMLGDRKPVCGLCEKHVGLMHNIVSRNTSDVSKDTLLVSAKHSPVVVVQLFAKRKRTLLEELCEAEKHFAQRG